MARQFPKFSPVIKETLFIVYIDLISLNIVLVDIPRRSSIIILRYAIFSVLSILLLKNYSLIFYVILINYCSCSSYGFLLQSLVQAYIQQWKLLYLLFIYCILPVLPCD